MWRPGGATPAFVNFAVTEHSWTCQLTCLFQSDWKVRLPYNVIKKLCSPMLPPSVWKALRSALRVAIVHGTTGSRLIGLRAMSELVLWHQRQQ